MKHMFQCLHMYLISAQQMTGERRLILDFKLVFAKNCGVKTNANKYY